MRKITAKEARAGYRVVFRHPVHGNSISRGLGSDKVFADAVCFLLTLICNDKARCQADIATVPEVKLREVGYGASARKAMEIFYGPHTIIDKLFANDDRGLTDADLREVVERAQAWNATNAGVPNCSEYDKETGHLIETDPMSSVNPQAVAEIMERLMPAKVRELQGTVQSMETEIQSARSDREELKDVRDQNRMLMRRFNLHVKEKIGVAAKKWCVDLKKQCTPRYARDAGAWLTKFILSLPDGDDFPLSELRRQHVVEWIRQMNKKPRTLLKRRNYITGFARWCVHEYDLVNPLQDMPTIKGVGIHEKVTAIQSFKEFQSILKALEAAPYWKTVIALCVLAGPRLGELLRSKIDDVKRGWLDIHSTKTDRRFRVVPIEETVLQPLLDEHIKRRREERESATSAIPLRSDLLFPSIVPAGPIERTKTDPAVWSGGRIFLDTFNAAKATAKSKLPKGDAFRNAPIWKYTPQIFRHTFGSIMARTGMSALQISRLMGNSPEVAATHYIDQCSHLAPWPVKWPTRFSDADV